jgi:exodeoxyribonuclease-1
LSSAVRAAKAKDLKNEIFKFEDPRLTKLLVLYKARNFPESLTQAEKNQYEEYKEEKFATSTKDRPSKEEYLNNIENMRKTKLSVKNKKILDKLEEWAKQS